MYFFLEILLCRNFISYRLLEVMSNIYCLKFVVESLRMKMMLLIIIKIILKLKIKYFFIYMYKYISKDYIREE